MKHDLFPFYLFKYIESPIVFFFVNGSLMVFWTVSGPQIPGNLGLGIGLQTELGCLPMGPG